MTEPARILHTPVRRERFTLLILITVCFIAYAYFFQGGGWNQNSRFDLTRALVEWGTFDITAYAGNTGDYSMIGGRIYSNKSPGLSLLAAPVYAALLTVEGMLSLDPNAPHVVNMNSHVLSIFFSGLPAVLLVFLVFRTLRTSGMSLNSSVFLALGFGLGTIFLPWAGTFFCHNFVAFLLFAAWYLFSRGIHPQWAALCTGLAMLVDYTAGPPAMLLLIYGWIKDNRTTARKLTLFLFPSACIAILLFIQASIFGSVFSTSYSSQDAYFTDSGLFLGMFEIPRIQRLYWLTFHPFIGLFYICPILIPCIASVLRPAFYRSSAAREIIVPLCITVYFFILNMSFNGWTGGWGFGPRYLIPVIPFIFILIQYASRPLRVAALTILPFSIAGMLAVTSVRTMIPAPNYGPPTTAVPLFDSLVIFLEGRMSISTQHMLEYSPTPGDPDVLNRWDSYNLGEVAGLDGFCSLLPLFLVLSCAIVLLLRISRAGVHRVRVQENES